MKIIIRKKDEGYEIEASDEEILSLFQKLLNELSKYNEEEVGKVEEKVQDILGQLLGDNK